MMLWFGVCVGLPFLASMLARQVAFPLCFLASQGRVQAYIVSRILHWAVNGFTTIFLIFLRSTAAIMVTIILDQRIADQGRPWTLARLP